MKESPSEYDKDRERLTVRHEFVKPSGSKATLVLQVSRTERGPRAVGVVNAVLTWAAQLKYGDRQREATKAGLFYALKEVYEKDGDDLSAFGLKGIYREDIRGILEWKDALERVTVAISRLEAAGKT